MAAAAGDLLTPLPRSGWAAWSLWVASAVLLACLYLPTGMELVRLWELDPNYSHGWLVPLLAVGLAWRKGTPSGASAPALGSLTLASGIMLHLAAVVLRWPILDFAGLVLILRGWALCVGGRPLASAWLFPSLLLFFMFPLPVVWTNAAAVWLQEWVSRASAAVLNLITVCHREGYTLTLAGLSEPLVVAEECSGLRQMVAFVALAALLGEWRERGWGGRLILLATAVPAAVLANLGRVLLMAGAAQSAGSAWLSTWLHDVPAFFTLPLGLALLLAVDAALPVPVRPQTRSSLPSEPRSSAAQRSGFVVAVGVLLAGAVAQVLLWWHLIEDPGVVYPEMALALSEFPQQLPAHSGDMNLVSDKGIESAQWLSQDDPTNHVLAPKLRFADAFINRVYTSPKLGMSFGLYAVYSRHGADREHHPEVCLRDAGGALEVTRDRALVPLDAAGKALAQRFTFRSRGQPPITVYYWHYTFLPVPDQRRRTWLQEVYQRQLQRPPSVTVQVTARQLDPRQRCIIEQHLLPLVHAAWQRQLPTALRVGHDRLPIRVVRTDLED